MSLSSRADRYLGSLKRGEYAPVEDVTDALNRAGCPIVQVWLTFHERYAGYQEPLGPDLAIWGLVHRSPEWLDPGEVSVESFQDTWRIVCADVHPSYDYWLDSNGEFDSLGGGGRCQSFDVKIEQNAMFWEAMQRARTWQQESVLLDLAGSVAALCRAAGCHAVPEASDRYTACWQSDDVIVLEREGGSRVWVAAEHRDQIVSRIKSA